MTLAQRIKNALSNISSKAKICALTTAGAAALFFAQEAQAKDYDEWIAPKRETSIIAQLSDKKFFSELNRYIDGYARAGTTGSWTTRRETSSEGIFTDANATLKLDRFRISADTAASWVKFPDDLNPNLEIGSLSGLAGLAAYLIQTEQAELFAKLQGGYEVNRLSVALKDGVADRALLGVQVGLALNRFRASTSFLYGNGPCSYRLLSGFNERGGFETFFVEGDASYLIWGNGEKKNYTSSGSFDQYYAGEDLEKSIYAMLQGFWRKDRMSRLQDSNAFGIEGALPIVFNGYDYSKDEQGNIHAKGFLIRMTPYTSYGESNSSSDLVARSTNTPGFANGIRFEVEHGRYVGTRLDGRYVFERVNTRDPVNGDSSKDGGKFELSLEFYLRF